MNLDRPPFLNALITTAAPTEREEIAALAGNFETKWTQASEENATLDNEKDAFVAANEYENALIKFLRKRVASVLKMREGQPEIKLTTATLKGVLSKYNIQPTANPRDVSDLLWMEGLPLRECNPERWQPLLVDETEKQHTIE